MPAQARADQRRRNVAVGVVAVTLVVVVVIVVALAAVTGSHSSTTTTAGTGTAHPGVTSTLPAAVLHAVANVPARVLDQVGIGGYPISSDPADNVLSVVKATRGGPSVASAALATVDGKPQFFFFGAEFCPYCATLRWSLIVALSRFGSFSGLLPTASTPPDPVVETFTFRDASYASPYVAFVPVEVENQNRAPLQSPTATQMKILSVWNAGESIPWFDIAGRYVGGIPAWDNPDNLVGLSRSAIAQSLSQPANPVGQALDAAANYISAGICNVDDDRPAAVCTSSGVGAAKAQLTKAPAATVIPAS